MKTVDLSKAEHTLEELLALAKSESLFIHLPTGEDFLLEQADDFDREVATLGESERFMSFLSSRAEETEEVSLSEARAKRNL